MKLLWDLFTRAKKIPKTIYVQPDPEYGFSGGTGTVHYLFADTGNLLVTVPGRDDDFEVAEDGRIIAATRVLEAQTMAIVA